MKLLGAHLSIKNGIDKIQNDMDSLNADTCALFVKNQRRYTCSPLSDNTIKNFKKNLKKPSILLPHGSYLLNLANPITIEKTYNCFIDDLKRCHGLGIIFYNLHPGSDVGKIKDKNKAMEYIAKNINQAHKDVPDVVILLENMAGQGNTIGRTFEELSYIISKVEDKDRIGVTLDTAHLFGGGYDIRTDNGFEKVMQDFDKIVGLRYLKAMHLNDSKVPLNSRRDRHEAIGKGYIGLEAFRYIMNSKYFEDIPMILETPDETNYKNEIELLKSLIKND